nr:mitochondrial arginine transporter bac2 [Quercus suber]
MNFWPEFLASSWGREFVAGGFGGIGGVITGYPLDTIRIWQQQSSKASSAFSILRNVVATEGPAALYKGMAAPLASVTFQNAMVFQIYAVLSQALDSSVSAADPPSHKAVALGGFGTGAFQSLILTPVQLVKIRLQLQNNSYTKLHQSDPYKGPGCSFSWFFYFYTYEDLWEKLHPGCRKSGQESLNTMLVAGGLAGVASWVSCYPLDVVKTRLQAQSLSSPQKYTGIVDCFGRIVKDEGYHMLWRGLGTTIAQAFVMNGAIFSSYEIALRCLFNNRSIQ